MRYLVIAIFLGPGFWLFDGQVVQAEAWKCIQKDGIAVFTDTPRGYLTCEKYQPPTLQGLIPERGPERGRDQQVPPGPPVTEPASPVSENRASDQSISDRRPQGQIDFQTFRLLSVGMSEGEVLGLAGPPAHEYKLTCDFSLNFLVSCPKRWVYSSQDDWIIELTLLRGRLANINNTRVLR